jgi:hypothetical protein
LLYRRRSFKILQSGYVDDFIERVVDPFSQPASVIPPVVEGEQLKAIPVMQFEELCHQYGSGLLAELARQIADADFGILVSFPGPKSDFGPTIVFGGINFRTPL